MADKKISALTASTTPLAGTEVLPIVQSGSTVKVAVSDLTAGRIVSSTGSNITGVGSKVTFDTTGLAAANYIYTTSSFNLTLYAGRGSTVQVDLTTDNVDSYVGGVRQSRLGTTGLTLDTGNLIIGTSGKGIDFSATSGSGTSELLADYEEGTWTPIDDSGAGLSFTSVEGTYTKVGRLVTCFFSLTFPSTASASSARIGGLPFTVPAGTSGLNDAILTVNTSSLVIQPYATNNATNFGLLLTYTGSGATNVQLTTAVLRGSITYSV
jgi:hypothetical protein